jgi:hypothetical protein
VRILQLVPFSVPLPSPSGSEVRFAQNARAAALLELLLDVVADEEDEVDVLVGAGLEVATEVAVDVAVGLVEPPPPPPPQADRNAISMAGKNKELVFILFSLIHHSVLSG